MNFDDNIQLFSHLPRASQDKIRRLLDDRERAFEAMTAAWQRLTDERADLARVKIVAASQERAAAQATRRIGFSLTQDEAMLSSNRRALSDEEVERLDDRVQAAQERVDRVDAAHKAAEHEWAKFAFLQDTTDWLQTYVGRDGRLGHQALPAEKLQRGETFAQAVERIRAQMAACDDEWLRIENAPQPLDTLKAAIVDQVDRLAAAGQPRILGRDNPAGPTNLNEVLKIRAVEGRPVSDCAGPLLAWLNRDQIIAKLHGEAENLDLADAMTDQARDAAFARLLDQRLALAFEEEAFICSAAEQGTSITRRRDADPRAILEIREVFANDFSLEKEEVEEHQRPTRRRAPAQKEPAE